jgi:hypothetical protein
MYNPQSVTGLLVKCVVTRYTHIPHGVLDFSEFLKLSLKLQKSSAVGSVYSTTAVSAYCTLDPQRSSFIHL